MIEKLPLLLRRATLYGIIGCLVLFCFQPLSIIAANFDRVVTGEVTNEKGEVMVGVSVLLKGTSKGTATNNQGKFQISVPDENSVLVLKYIGYSDYEVKVGNQKNLTVQMNTKSESLDEVVVVGYGTQKKVNATGAIDVVKGDALINRPTANVSQSLQGKVSGVNFSTPSYGFEPGAELNLQIRGQGSPLVLIDGSVGSLNNLNPNDIESISVLKDAAAAAIYGARAPYGVVLVTTKSGGSDNKLSVSYSSSYSQISPIRMHHHLNSYTAALAMNEAAANTGVNPVYTNNTIDRILAYQANPSTTPETVPSSANSNLWANTFESNANHDWFNLFYGNGFRNQQNLSLSGGSKAVSFFVSGGYAYDGGILQVGIDNFNRYNTTAKFDANLTKWLKLTSITRFTNSKRQKPAFDNQGDYDLLFHQVARTFPSQYMISPNGVYSIQSKIPWTRDAGTEITKTNEVQQQFSTQFNIAKGISFNVDYTYRINSTVWDSNNYTVYEDAVNGSPIISGSTSPSYVARSQQLYLYNTLNTYAKFDKNINKDHQFNLLIGYQQEYARTTYLWARKNDMASQEVPSIATSTGTIDATDDNTVYATQGVFSRFSYNYKEKYLFEFNSRYDGTYKYAADKRWGFFPSVSLGWNVSNEDFWSSVSSSINAFKLRGSVGSLGNQLTATAYQDIPLMGIGSNLGWIINNRRPGYVTAPNLINQDITWEVSNTKNLGIDLGFFKNKLTVTGDVYNRTTFDQLGPSQALPAVLGATLPLSNNMETSTNGWEFSATWRDKVGKDFSYSVTGMVFDYTTKIKKYNNPTNLLSNPYVGQTQGEIWGLVTSGLIKTADEAAQINAKGTQKAISGQVWKTGDVRYTDLNGDGVIDYGNNTLDNPGDRTIIGNNTPHYQFGLTLAAKWKNFDLSMFWQGTGKRDLALTGNMFWGFSTAAQSSLFDGHLNYYRDTDADKYKGLGMNLDSYFPRPYNDANMNAKNQNIQSRYLQDGAYARLKNLQLGYTLPSALLNKIKLQQLYVYISGENLITLTKLPSYFDPETANVGVRGDGKSYFSQQAFTLGINLKF